MALCYSKFKAQKNRTEAGEAGEVGEVEEVGEVGEAEEEKLILHPDS